MAILVQSGDPGRKEPPPRFREDLKQRHQRATTADELRAMLGALGLAQCHVARLFAVGPRSVRRWRDGERRIPRGVNIVLRLLATGAVTVAQVEQAAVPIPARANGGAEEEPPAPLRVEPVPEEQSASARARTATLANGDPITTAEKVVALASDACHWPYGDPRDRNFRFCGKPTVKGSYCERHRARAYLAPRTGSRHGAGVGFVAHWRQPRPQPAPAHGRPSIPGAFSATGASRAPKILFDRAGDLLGSAPPPA